jgi:potassium-transporting ATPase KdpC subunit
MRNLRPAILMTVVLTVLTGIVYPFAVFGVAQVLFPAQANGSLIVRGGRVIGSRLIGQNFSGDRYFHPRPSAAGDKGYDASNSGGSNLAPSNRALIDTVRLRLRTLLKSNRGTSAGQVPIDLVTASASGLDPEISPAGAEFQVRRVAKARGMSPDAVRAVVRKFTRPRFADAFGEPGVNVLLVNLALDKTQADARSRAER